MSVMSTLIILTAFTAVISITQLTFMSKSSHLTNCLAGLSQAHSTAPVSSWEMRVGFCFIRISSGDSLSHTIVVQPSGQGCELVFSTADRNMFVKLKFPVGSNATTDENLSCAFRFCLCAYLQLEFSYTLIWLTGPGSNMNENPNVLFKYCDVGSQPPKWVGLGLFTRAPSRLAAMHESELVIIDTYKMLLTKLRHLFATLSYAACLWRLVGSGFVFSGVLAGFNCFIWLSPSNLLLSFSFLKTTAFFRYLNAISKSCFGAPRSFMMKSPLKCLLGETFFSIGFANTSKSATYRTGIVLRTWMSQGTQCTSHICDASTNSFYQFIESSFTPHKLHWSLASHQMFLANRRQIVAGRIQNTQNDPVFNFGSCSAGGLASAFMHSYQYAVEQLDLCMTNDRWEALVLIMTLIVTASYQTFLILLRGTFSDSFT